jgi:hypothetical protein
MFERLFWWSALLLKPEDGAGDGDAGGGADGGAGGGGNDGGNGGVNPNPGAAQSLRSQLAAALPEADRDPFNKWAGGFATDTDFAKSALNLRSTYDNRVPIPKPDDKPEVIKGFWQKVGMPKEAKEYAYDFGKTEDGKPVALDDDETARFERFKEYAHEHNFTQSQFTAGVKFLEEDTAKQMTAVTAASNKATADSEKLLKSEWGPDFDDNLAFAEDAAVDFAGKDEWTKLAELRLEGGMKVGSHPTLVKMLAKIGRMNGNDQRVRRMNETGEAEDIKAKIAEIEEEAFKAGQSTAEERWHKQLQPLYEKLYPTKHTNVMGGRGFGG